MLLFKFLTIVGSVLAGLLMLVSSLLEPGSSRQSGVKATSKAIVEHAPRASLFERARAEEAARKAAAKDEIILVPLITVAEPAAPVTRRAESVSPRAGEAQAEPVHVSAPATVRTAATTESASERAVRLKRKKMKAERRRQKRLARDRVRALQAASRRQYEVYYGYAPQPTYGPFGWRGQAQRW